ncbi:sensor histidine kinase [Nonomuraea roseola]|uniref:histidine kinase n=1 Tax=Nonomuraea roseola TaxID=46179 RepID=A0ABV5PTQ8_9ACTN
MHHEPPRPPLLQRLPPGTSAVLTGCAVAIFAVTQYVMLLNEDEDVHPEGMALAGVAVAMALPLVWARRRPAPVLVVMLGEVAAAMAAGVSAEQIWPVLLAADILVGLIAATRTHRAGITVAGVTLAVQEAAWHLDLWRNGYRALAPGFLALTILLAAFVVLAWLAGAAIRQRREYGQALRAHAAAQAVTAERLRIARELHDMVAHSIGVIAIQAGAGRRVIDAHPAQARDVLDAIETTSRETLKGLRSMVGVLRRSEAPSPQVGLASLDRLMATTTAAGVHVDLRWQGERRPLPAPVDQSAFRIVQEAVTNVVRHAGTPHCHVSIDYGGEELRIEVVDDGRGTTTAEGDGFGIPGMRERVALLNGHFIAGPRPEGGFRVAARLPIPAGAP